MTHTDIETSDGRKARLYKGTPKADAPKSYIKVGVIGHSIGNNYNPSTLTLYINKQGILKYEIYRDGCFYPYYGTFEYMETEK